MTFVICGNEQVSIVQEKVNYEKVLYQDINPYLLKIEDFSQWFSVSYAT